MLIRKYLILYVDGHVEGVVNNSEKEDIRDGVHNIKSKYQRDNDK